VGQYERLILLAEDQLTEYSSDARKIEKLRQKFGLSVSRREQDEIRKQLETELPSGGIAKIVEDQRQAVSLPFWGIAGLGLLFGIAAGQPLDYLATAAGVGAAIFLQKWGWQLQAKRLVLQTLQDIKQRIENPSENK
jgi:mitochondrial fission protein ELM1